jgi:hypothetical protein
MVARRRRRPAEPDSGARGKGKNRRMHTDREQPAADMSTTRALPLAGVTVLDLGRIYNGPYAAFLMAASGARRGSRILTS